MYIENIFDTDTLDEKVKSKLDESKDEKIYMDEFQMESMRNGALDESSKTFDNGYYIINHKGTNRSVVSNAMSQSDALKMKQNQGKGNIPYFGLNQDHDLLYFDGKEFKHTKHDTAEPVGSYTNNQKKLFENHITEISGEKFYSGDAYVDTVDINESSMDINDLMKGLQRMRFVISYVDHDDESLYAELPDEMQGSKNVAETKITQRFGSEVEVDTEDAYPNEIWVGLA